MNKIIITLLVLTYSLSLFARVPKIVFVSPDPIDTKNRFWHDTIKYFNVASKSLGIDSKVIYGHANRYEYLEAVKKGFLEKPDFLITIIFNNAVKTILESSQSTNTKILFINGKMSASESKEVGQPREKYPNWIGQFYPDDVEAGRLELDCLTKGKKLVKGKYKLLAVNGALDSPAAIDRAEGLNAGVKKLGFDLTDIFYGAWDESRGFLFGQKYIDNKSDYYFWTGSDLMAIGLSKKTDELKAHNNVHIAGIDWNHEAIDLVRNKKIDCSVGGHHLEIFYATVALYDYFNGIDFKDDLGLTFKSPFYVIDQSNADKYVKFVESADKVDAKKFSKAFSPKLKKYKFNQIVKDFY